MKKMIKDTLKSTIAILLIVLLLASSIAFMGILTGLLTGDIQDRNKIINYCEENNYKVSAYRGFAFGTYCYVEDELYKFQWNSELNKITRMRVEDG